MDIMPAMAAAATFATVAAGAAVAPASAAPVMSGNYVLTVTDPVGRATLVEWNVNPCGEGCADIKAGPGYSRAQLVDGQWVIDMFDYVRCSDGTRVPYAANAHITWDPNTLAGTEQLVYTQAACGQPPGYTQPNRVQLKQAS